MIKNLVFAGIVLAIACTPKSAPKMADTPATATEPQVWNEMGKPVAGDEGDTAAIPDVFSLQDLVIEPEADAASLDTLPPYNPSNTFEYDLLHTKLELSFDWAKKWVVGKATLSMRPWFYPIDKVVLDAKGFDIQSVTFDGQTSPLKFDYDNLKLTVHLGKAFSKKEDIKLAIKYVAKPDERTDIGGSAAITSDKGLYFINADGSEGEKPRQIWTQGETEANSCWFPTNDKPNERCTQEMYLTVEDKYKTLSNGVLANQKKNADGTRTDYWKMDKPHAPYLFMIGVGEFAVVKDKWNGIELEYWVEPKYAADAKEIYPYTPEMLDFFSKKLNYNYPWSKFSQIIVRDFVSGAMENTTAVIFGDFIQQTKRELLDGHWTNEKIVAHEMFHHWFGDLVTTESWANLTLNEGFANYSEFLWMEHKHGADEAAFHLLQEQQGYFAQASDGGHPLIDFGYGNREDMFDAHSYNKGGCVLNMLREVVGEEAFWASLNFYLKKNEFTDVESHELRMAFEDVTGRDLNWFWNQWHFGAGHPKLEIAYDWDEAAKTMNVNVKQTQQGKDVARVFDLPLAVDIYDASGKARREQIRMTKREQTFSFKSETRPALVNFDATKNLLCQKSDAHSDEEWAFMYRHAPLFRDRWEALEALAKANSPLARTIGAEALNDKFHAIRRQALGLVDGTDASILPTVEKIAAADPEPGTRAAAIEFLGETGDKKFVPTIQKGLEQSAAYSVLGAAMSVLAKIDPQSIVAMSKDLENEETPAVVVNLAELFAQNPDASKLAWFQKQQAKIDEMAAFAFFAHYQAFIVGLKDAAAQQNAVESWKGIALDGKTSQWRRFSATKSLADMRNFYRDGSETAKAAEIQQSIEEIKSKETDPTLKLYYDMF